MIHESQNVVKSRIGKDSINLFKYIQSRICDDEFYRGKHDRIEDFYLKLSRTILHEKGLLEFKKRFNEKVGDCILINDYNNPTCNNARDGVISSYNCSRIIGMKLGRNNHNVNFKYGVPTSKHKALSISKKHYMKYIKEDVKVIFMVPNGSDPRYYEDKEAPSATEHSYYWLDLNTPITPLFIDGFGKRYYEISNMVNFRLISKDQTQIKDYELKW